MSCRLPSGIIPTKQDYGKDVSNLISFVTSPEFCKDPWHSITIPIRNGGDKNGHIHIHRISLDSEDVFNIRLHTCKERVCGHLICSECDHSLNRSEPNSEVRSDGHEQSLRNIRRKKKSEVKLNNVIPLAISRPFENEDLYSLNVYNASEFESEEDEIISNEQYTPPPKKASCALYVYTNEKKRKISFKLQPEIERFLNRTLDKIERYTGKVSCSSSRKSSAKKKYSDRSSQSFRKDKGSEKNVQTTFLPGVAIKHSGNSATDFETFVKETWDENEKDRAISSSESKGQNTSWTNLHPTDQQPRARVNSVHKGIQATLSPNLKDTAASAHNVRSEEAVYKEEVWTEKTPEELEQFSSDDILKTKAQYRASSQNNGVDHDPESRGMINSHSKDFSSQAKIKPDPDGGTNHQYADISHDNEVRNRSHPRIKSEHRDFSAQVKIRREPEGGSVPQHSHIYNESRTRLHTHIKSEHRDIGSESELKQNLSHFEKSHYSDISSDNELKRGRSGGKLKRENISSDSPSTHNVHSQKKERYTDISPDNSFRETPHPGGGRYYSEGYLKTARLPKIDTGVQVNLGPNRRNMGTSKEFIETLPRDTNTGVVERIYGEGMMSSPYQNAYENGGFEDHPTGSRIHEQELADFSQREPICPPKGGKKKLVVCRQGKCLCTADRVCTLCVRKGKPKCSGACYRKTKKENREEDVHMVLLDEPNMETLGPSWASETYSMNTRRTSNRTCDDQMQSNFPSTTNKSLFTTKNRILKPCLSNARPGTLLKPSMACNGQSFHIRNNKQVSENANTKFNNILNSWKFNQYRETAGRTSPNTFVTNNEDFSYDSLRSNLSEESSEKNSMDSMTPDVGAFVNRFPQNEHSEQLSSSQTESSQITMTASTEERGNIFFRQQMLKRECDRCRRPSKLSIRAKGSYQFIKHSRHNNNEGAMLHRDLPVENRFSFGLVSGEINCDEELEELLSKRRFGVPGSTMCTYAAFKNPVRSENEVCFTCNVNEVSGYSMDPEKEAPSE